MATGISGQPCCAFYFASCTKLGLWIVKTEGTRGTGQSDGEGKQGVCRKKKIITTGEEEQRR